ncbi:hypothetical protein KY290_022019 [Solanum tuberosum]|uniref:Uncharacterized protein n=1 Tax=Solanum tuberosum TaxID=4113 RepID=A0ABQ7V548_SOLTU|nr:hypothetical protein KY289_021173 [Solanum tuberosum]KAH0758526.1 hypothetical protein KY290_022019 [Solanum tuberosum]
MYLYGGSELSKTNWKQRASTTKPRFPRIRDEGELSLYEKTKFLARIQKQKKDASGFDGLIRPRASTWHHLAAARTHRQTVVAGKKHTNKAVAKRGRRG